MRKNKGLFITFEGGEGSGKSSLIDSLEKYFLNLKLKIVKTREPGGTILSEKIRDLVLHFFDQKNVSPYSELALYLASRSQHVQDVIIPSIEADKIILCDRFNDSSIAYQGYARGLGMDKVKEICSFFSQNVSPDLTFYLDLSPEVGFKRMKSADIENDRIEAEGQKFHEKVRDAYKILAKNDPNRLHIIDATKSKEEVFEKSIKIIEDFLS